MAITESIREGFQREHGISLDALNANPRLAEQISYHSEKKDTYAQGVNAERADMQNRLILKNW